MKFFAIRHHSVFNVWLKTTLLPVWHRDAKSLDTPITNIKVLVGVIYPNLYCITGKMCRKRQHQLLLDLVVKSRDLKILKEKIDE